jgi:16S rRNA (guanine527-N7)-methyltransferase
VKQSAKNKAASLGISKKLENDLAGLRDLAAAHGVVIDDNQFEKMLSFIELLQRWNRSINLISRGEAERIVNRHVAESVALLALAEPTQSALVMDIGSGGGFPAIPMKILRPDMILTLVESNGKKAAFLRNIGIKLCLEDYCVKEGRMELLPSESSFSIITARAVAELGVLWTWATNHLIQGGRLLAIKGGNVAEELESLREFGNISKISTIEFPGWLNIDKSRFVISLDKK